MHFRFFPSQFLLSLGPTVHGQEVSKLLDNLGETSRDRAPAVEPGTSAGELPEATASARPRHWDYFSLGHPAYFLPMLVRTYQWALQTGVLVGKGVLSMSGSGGPG